jgi:hypothetical protein
MIAGIMQPYFFPYFGYFDHISRCDIWVVLDITQYTPQSWMNRNRILHPEKSWQYLGCNICHASQNTPISSIRLLDVAQTRKKMLGQLVHYQRRAPYYRQVVELVERSFAEARSDQLTDVDVSGLSVVCDYLSIPFTPVIASEAEFALPEITHAGQWALEICTRLGATAYLNTPGGREIFHPDEFKARGIRLGFTRVPEFVYDCPSFAYEPHLSILDVLMWNSPEKVWDAMGKTPVDYVF